MPKAQLYGRVAKIILVVPSLGELPLLFGRQDMLQRNEAARHSGNSSVLGARILGFYYQVCHLLTASPWESTSVILGFVL